MRAHQLRGFGTETNPKRAEECLPRRIPKTPFSVESPTLVRSLAPMDSTTIGLIGSTVVGFAAAAFAWIKWLHEIRDKRLERTAKQEAEKQLSEIRRRSLINSPYFKVTENHIPLLKITNSHSIISCRRENLLTLGIEEVREDCPTGEAVYLALKNQGIAAYDVTIKLEGMDAELLRAERFAGNSLYVLRYSFDVAQRGRDQVMEVQFMSADGVRDSHKYVTQHGMRRLTRIDPA